jgi:hypothetical protein
MTCTPDGRRLGDAGREYVHVCVDDATRLAYAEVLSDEKATTAAGFLRRAVAFCRAHGIAVEAVLADNGPGYRSSAARALLPHARHQERTAALAGFSGATTSGATPAPSPASRPQLGSPS